jgi:hypothetical protein
MGTAFMALERVIGEAVKSALATMAGVAGVYCLPKGEVFQVFTIIVDDDEALYDEIYERERSLIRRFDGVHFDFNVIASRGRSIEEIVGSDVEIRQTSGWPDLCPDATNI